MIYPENDNTEALILRAKSGDEEAFELLVVMYRPMIDSVIKRFSLDVDEMFSEACMGFYRAVTTYSIDQGNVTFGLYAKICVERCLIDVVRKSGHDISGRIDTEIDVDTIAVSDGIQSMLEHREQMAHFLKLAKNTLSDFEYDVYRYWMFGYKTADIADAMGTTAKSIDNAKNRMMKKLRDKLSSAD